MTVAGADIGRSNCRYVTKFAFMYVLVQVPTTALVRVRDSVCVIFLLKVSPFFTHVLFIVIYNYYEIKIRCGLLECHSL